MNTTTQNNDDSSVCACRYVRRKAFIETVRQRRLKTVEEVRAATFVNTSCSICHDTVQDILDELNNTAEPIHSS